MVKKSSGKKRKITVASMEVGIGKVRQADHLLGLGRDAVVRAKASAIAWINSKKPHALASASKVRNKTRKPMMAHKTARKGPSKG
jgi:thiazole synthase ThiGH ThiG subunit